MLITQYFREHDTEEIVHSLISAICLASQIHWLVQSSTFRDGLP